MCHSTTLIYVMLFCSALLNKFEYKLDASFKKVKLECYSKHRHCFYVYAKPNNCDTKNIIKYIRRYLRCSVNATSRIDHYGGEKCMEHPSEGITSNNIRNTSEDKLLDMDYSLNKYNLFDDEADVEYFISSKTVLSHFHALYLYMGYFYSRVQ